MPLDPVKFFEAMFFFFGGAFSECRWTVIHHSVFAFPINVTFSFIYDLSIGTDYYTKMLT